MTGGNERKCVDLRGKGRPENKIKKQRGQKTKTENSVEGNKDHIKDQSHMQVGNYEGKENELIQLRIYIHRRWRKRKWLTSKYAWHDMHIF